MGKDRIARRRVFVQDELQVTRSLWITAGLRVDYFSDFGADLEPAGGGRLSPHPKVSFKLLYGRAFRAPTFRDLYDQTGVSETAGGLPSRATRSCARRRRTRSRRDWRRRRGAPDRARQLLLHQHARRHRRRHHVHRRWRDTDQLPGLQIWGGEAEAQLHLDEHNYLSANLSLFDSVESGAGLDGWQTTPERRFVDPHLVDLPRLRLNAIAVVAPFQRLRRAPAPIGGLTLGLRWGYVSGIANNNRFSFETLDVFRQPRFTNSGPT